MIQSKTFLFFFLLLFVNSCQKQENQIAVETEDSYNWIDDWEVPEHRKKILESDKFHTRVKDCLKDTNFILLTSSLLNDRNFQYSTFKSLGDINHDGKEDSIFVLPELLQSDETGIEMGASIIFTNQMIPRIQSSHGCINVEQIFPVGDVDEDGIVELGRFYTSCASRFKAIDLLSLKKGKWQNMGRVTFDIAYDQPPKEERIRKTGKSSFEMRQITQGSGSTVSDEWVPFEMK